MFYVRKLGLLTAVLAVMLSVVLPPAAVFAQAATTRPPLNLSTSPIPLNVVTKPNSVVTADIRVKNNGNAPEKLKIELLKFGANGTSGDPQLHEREAKDTYFDWVSFSETTFTAEPGVWKTVKMTIKTPPDAAFGYYLAVLFSRAVPDKPATGSSAVEGGVASLVLLDVEAPGAKREAKVISLTADRKVYEFLPANLQIKLRNAGNIHVAPTGSIFIKRGGSQVAVLDFNTARGNILPGSSRTFDTSWNDGFPAYDVKVNGDKTTKTLKWDFSKLQKFRFGHYTATLVAVYDDGQRDVPVEATVGFWIIPWRILGVVLLILLLAGAGVWMIFRGILKKLFPGRKKPPKDDSGAAAASPPASPAVAETAAAEPAAVQSDTPAPVPEQSAKPAAAENTIGTTAPAVPPSAAKTKKNKRSRRKKASASAAPQTDERKTAPELKD